MVQPSRGLPFPALGTKHREPDTRFREGRSRGLVEYAPAEIRPCSALRGRRCRRGELHVRSHAQRQGDISYIVHPRVWGQGIGTGIGRELLSRAFGQSRLHRISATCDPRNLGSARVLAKLGMTYAVRLRHTAWIRDGWRDSLMFQHSRRGIACRRLGGMPPGTYSLTAAKKDSVARWSSHLCDVGAGR
ncbi:GNAT family N-acetyltransferase [Streptomyces chartreusis]|uniref:GNAT family N-acetyltransferase n=1 Tax=Streptomyces chartreusis TaxID=1969 RepID=UPI0036AC66DF